MANAGNPDLDEDLLPVACEAIAGTDTDAADSDGDDILDGIEFLRIGTSAINAKLTATTAATPMKWPALNSLHRQFDRPGVLASRYGLVGNPLYFWDFDVNRDGAINSLDLLFVALQSEPVDGPASLRIS